MARPNIYGAQVMLHIWWDQFCVMYYEMLKPSETITRDRYWTQLMRLNSALKKKRSQYQDKLKWKEKSNYKWIEKILWIKNLLNLQNLYRVSVPITADRKSRRLLKLKKNSLRWKSRREWIFKVGITAGLHELLRTNYFGSPNYCAPTTAETPITKRVILRYYFEWTYN